MAAEPTDLNSRRAEPIRAAAVRLDAAVKAGELRRQVQRHERWQDEAWGYYDEIGEVHYATNVVADALARGRLYVGIRPEPEADLIPVGDPASGVSSGLATEAEMKLAELRSPIGGQAQLIRQAAINSMVPGEWYLVRGVADELGTDAWYVRSTEDVTVTGTGDAAVTKVRGMTTVAAEDVSRVWQPHPRRFEVADSGMRAVLGQCETILLIDRQFRASLRSRLFAGLLLLPNNLRSGRPDPTTADAGDGEATDDPVIADILTALDTAIQNEGSASAVVPNMLWGDGETLQHARLLQLGQQIDPNVSGLRTDTLRRVAQGLDMPPEIVLGMGDVNHWQAWFVGEEFVNSLEPKASFLADAFTQVFLRPELAVLGFDPAMIELLEVGLDLEVLKRRPNVAEDANNAWDRIAISNESYRRARGFDEADAPSVDEVEQRIVQLRGRIDGPASIDLLRRSLDPSLPEPVAPAPASPGGGSGTAPSESPANGAPAPPIAAAAALSPASLMAIDAALRERLFAASLAAFRRALEKAGARARSKIAASHRPAVKDVPATQVVHDLGPTLLAAAALTDEQLLGGALESLHGDFHRWVAEAQGAAVAAAIFLAGSDPDQSDLDEAQSAHDAARDDAWEWFAAAAAVALRRHMRDGTMLADSEIRAMVRQALVRAGGASEVAPVTDPTAVAAGAGAGLATGVIVLGLLARQNVGVSGWEWIHGEPANPYPDHLDLHGDIESTEDGFGGEEPGNHGGCTCTLQPVLVSGGTDDTGDDDGGE